MFKQIKSLLLIVILALSVTMLLGTSAEAARTPSIKLNYYPPVYPGSICTDCTLVRLANVSINETLLEFAIFNLFVSFENDNPAGNAPKAGGTVHIGDRIVISRPIIDLDVYKNGTADIIELCITEAYLSNAILDAILPNDNWTNLSYDLFQFDVEWKLSQNDEVEHIIRATCEPSGENAYSCSVYYDSQE